MASCPPFIGFAPSVMRFASIPRWKHRARPARSPISQSSDDLGCVCASLAVAVPVDVSPHRHHADVYSPEPGVRCSGKLADRGIDDIVTTRPKASIPSESGYSSYSSASYSLVLQDRAVHAHLQRHGRLRCLESGLAVGRLLHWQTRRFTPADLPGDSSSSRRSSAIRVDIGGGMSKACFRYTKGMSDINRTGGWRRGSGDQHGGKTLASYAGGSSANSDSFRLGPRLGHRRSPLPLDPGQDDYARRELPQRDADDRFWHLVVPSTNRLVVGSSPRRPFLHTPR